MHREGELAQIGAAEVTEVNFTSISACERLGPNK
jgi:hypothetical protein